jgi:hypothetical protein
MATDENRDEIEQLIRQSCEVPAPDGEFVRTLAARATHELLSTLPEGPKTELPRLRETSTARPWRRAAFAVAGLAAAILVGVLLWSRQEGVAWAQVAEAVRAMPWIHMKIVGGEGQLGETWLSFPRNIAAMRYPNLVQYDDYRSGVRHEYDAQQKKLYRLAAAPAQDFKSTERFFQAIFRGNAIREEDFFGPRLIKQRQRTVTEQGRRWILYELELHGGDPERRDPDKREPVTMVIRVNPEKMLPDSATLTHGKEKREFVFDYPTEGPADVYALGVPRDARVEDRTPPPDLTRILKIVRQTRRDFDDYLAIAGGNGGHGGSSENSPFVVHMIRCKGDKFRVDAGIGDTRRVASGAEMEQWWQEHGKESLPEGSVLCDGRRLYERSRASAEAGWKPSMHSVRQGDGRGAAAGIRESKYFVELLAYPVNLDLHTLSLPQYTAQVDPKGENGPGGSVRVVLQLAKRGGKDDRSTYHKEEYWLQPKYGYAVVKRVASDCPAVDEDPRRTEKQIVYEYDDFRQTPRGVWYPTVSRWKNAIRSDNKNKLGGAEFRDQVVYFYLDFTAGLSDELFSATWQGDLLAGIHFVPRHERPASKDLGKIRPPGGVPLICSGREITVAALDKVRQRLEAVPKEDLEKWVVELERITDVKLKDGVPSARAVCRTEFVTRMSAAFDGLKWNAKAADALFQRAQSMPASEAKVWKEAFEVLLKKEIGQTDTHVLNGGPAWAVPLVLIPVDALHEGQKYSAERARKYLARLKQLTADDVLLWKDKVDQWGGTSLDAAVNIILLDDYFDKEGFQRGKFKAAIGAREK